MNGKNITLMLLKTYLLMLRHHEVRRFKINMFCDASHATHLITRRSTTGIIIFAQGTPILWYSKRQNTIETSTFGSEFVALKIATEMVEGFRYRLRMMGVPIQGCVNTFCDNDSVVKNVTNPASTLTKKHNAISYHKVRQSVAAEIQRIAFVPGKCNLSDMLTQTFVRAFIQGLLSMHFPVTIYSLVFIQIII